MRTGDLSAASHYATTVVIRAYAPPHRMERWILPPGVFASAWSVRSRAKAYKMLAYHQLCEPSVPNAGLQHDDGFERFGTLRVRLLVINLKTAKA